MSQSDNAKPELQEPRSSAEIFADLCALAQSEGALHEISALVYRDWIITVDMNEGRVADAPEHRWSTSKLHKNEFLLLLGLLVKAEGDRTFSVITTGEEFAARADRLLQELHYRILKDGQPAFDIETQKFIDRPEVIGMMAREAIYYGAESFYLHQLSHFSRLRYRDDATWLLQNVGLSIRPMTDIAQFIVDRVNRQIAEITNIKQDMRKLSHGDLTNSLLISKAEVQKRFGEKARNFLAKFTTPVSGANTDFDNPFAINKVAIAPIIDLGNHLYVPIQFRLFESIYESPSYWMNGDDAYKNSASDHRGGYLERTTAHILRSVFGQENVHENVTIRDNSKDIAGEIDVLVVYGEFALVVQAKSKRVTLKARAGDTEALKTDFEGAIQSPYNQAIKCLKLIRSGANCVTKEGNALTFPSFPRLFPVVILSDPFPSATFLSRAMLERGEAIAPVIWDIGVLDVVTRLLPTPIEMIFYLKCRSEVFDNVISDSEYNYLGYHIKSKLTLPNEADMMMLDRDFATEIDDFMMASDLGIQAKRPIGILERLKIPVISELLAELKTVDPRLAGVVIDLYDFSSAALEGLSADILNLRDEIARTGKEIKALSIKTAAGGLTYAVTRKRDAKAKMAAEAIGSKHKYDMKSDRWYVILDSTETNNPIDALLPLVWPWTEDEEEAKRSVEIAKLFKSRYEARTVGQAAARPLKNSF